MHGFSVQNLVSKNSKTVYDYIFVGVANQSFVDKAKKEGRDFPYYNHNGNFVVELAAIPLGALIGFTALIDMFNK